MLAFLEVFALHDLFLFGRTLVRVDRGRVLGSRAPLLGGVGLHELLLQVFLDRLDLTIGFRLISAKLAVLVLVGFIVTT